MVSVVGKNGGSQAAAGETVVWTLSLRQPRAYGLLERLPHHGCCLHAVVGTDHGICIRGEGSRWREGEEGGRGRKEREEVSKTSSIALSFHDCYIYQDMFIS